MLTKPHLIAGAVLFALGIVVGISIEDGREDKVVQPVALVGPSDDRAKIAAVVDGDTVMLETGEAVRLLGIDTPEVASQDCYASEATEFLRSLVEGQRVTLVGENEDKDRFGRLLRWVFLDDGTFVNADLVWEGYGRQFFFGESRYRQVFVQLQVAARSSGAGGWSACGWK